MPFRYIGGVNNMLKGPFYDIHKMVLVQTDGSFLDKTKKGNVVALIQNDNEYSQGYTYPLEHLESTIEAKWASIYFGLEMAKRNQQMFVGIENDSLSIIRNIIFNSPGKQEYARYYHNKIKDTVNDMEWAGIRWIPRGLNQADALLR